VDRLFRLFIFGLAILFVAGCATQQTASVPTQEKPTTVTKAQKEKKRRAEIAAADLATRAQSFGIYKLKTPDGKAKQIGMKELLAASNGYPDGTKIYSEDSGLGQSNQLATIAVRQGKSYFIINPAMHVLPGQEVPSGYVKYAKTSHYPLTQRSILSLLFLVENRRRDTSKLTQDNRQLFNKHKSYFRQTVPVRVSGNQ